MCELELRDVPEANSPSTSPLDTILELKVVIVGINVLFVPCCSLGFPPTTCLDRGFCKRKTPEAAGRCWTISQSWTSISSSAFRTLWLASSFPIPLLCVNAAGTNNMDSTNSIPQQLAPRYAAKVILASPNTSWVFHTGRTMQESGETRQLRPYPLATFPAQSYSPAPNASFGRDFRVVIHHLLEFASVPGWVQTPPRDIQQFRSESHSSLRTSLMNDAISATGVQPGSLKAN